MAGNDQKTEQPTPQRLERARKDGQFPVSREFVAGASLLCFVWMLTGNIEPVTSGAISMLQDLLTRAFHAEFTVLDSRTAITFLIFGPLSSPISHGFALLLLVLFVHLASTRFGFSWKRATPDFSRLSPGTKLKQLFPQNMTALAQSLVALPVFSWLLFTTIRDNWEAVAAVPRMGLKTGLEHISTAISSLLWHSAELLFVFGAIDLFRQKQKWMSQMRMSKQEIRDEHKQSEGNPQVKTRIRRIQRDMLRRRMMQQVPKATAVIVNPEHYAVAIRYQPGQMPAPKVVAKGKNWLALRIREVAVRNQVPVVENPPLARALYGSVQVGQEIPQHLYQAVAEILAYIYRLMKGRLPGSN